MEQTKLKSLPLFQNFETVDLAKTTDNFRKGEKGLFNFFKLALFGAIGYFSWVYVLPVVFQAIGQVLAIASSVTLVVALVLLAPVIFKALRRFTRFVHKSVIRHDPFGQLEESREKMVDNISQSRKSHGKIKALKQETEVEASNSEEKAKSYKSKILVLDKKSKELKSYIDEQIKKKGNAYKGEDEYVSKYAELTKTLSEGNRLKHMYEQEVSFISKYGMRANVLKKFDQKLHLVQNALEIQLLDFDATLEILKKDYAFAQKAREATDTAKSAMLFTEGWEVEFAIDVVTSTIAENIAITTGNLRDLDTITLNYASDPDEMFNNLSTLADNFNSGLELIPQAKDYANPEYQPTHKDKINSGGFGELF